MKTMLVAAMSMAACAMAGCSTAGPPPGEPPSMSMAAPPVPGTAGSTKVGPGSQAGFCTFKDAGGKLYEAKC